MGPLIDEVSLKGVQEKVDRAVSQGATLLTGGKRAEGKGFFFQPTLISRSLYSGYYAPRLIIGKSWVRWNPPSGFEPVQ